MDFHTVYLDNAATTFPKPKCVTEAMVSYLTEIGANINRGVYASASEAEQTIYAMRECICRLFRFDHPDHVILTPGNTFSINTVLNGFLKPGDHCLVSFMEHNAVMRPLNRLAKKRVSFDRIPCDRDGRIDLNAVPSLFRPETRLVFVAHASNVCGTVQDIESLGELCRQNGVSFVIDAAQSAGHIPIDFKAAKLSAMTLPGHKGLLGPSGTGLLLMEPSFAAKVEPLITGGTGSVSDRELQPSYLPDRFESGTLNLPGLFGLAAALSFLEKIGISNVEAKEQALTELFLKGLSDIPGICILGPANFKERTGVVSVDFLNRDNAECAYLLEKDFGILTRCGLHCAPAAHKTIGTFPKGTVRFSIGYFNTKEDIMKAVSAVSALTG